LLLPRSRWTAPTAPFLPIPPVHVANPSRLYLWWGLPHVSASLERLLVPRLDAGSGDAKPWTSIARPRLTTESESMDLPMGRAFHRRCLIGAHMRASAYILEHPMSGGPSFTATWARTSRQVLLCKSLLAKISRYCIMVINLWSRMLMQSGVASKQ
jgi:hypothetical protein